MMDLEDEATSNLTETATKEDLSAAIEHILRRLSASDNREKIILGRLSALEESLPKMIADLQHSIEQLPNRLSEFHSQRTTIENKPALHGTSNSQAEVSANTSQAISVMKELFSALIKHNREMDAIFLKIDQLNATPKPSPQAIRRVLLQVSQTKNDYAKAFDTKMPELIGYHKVALDSYVRNASRTFENFEYENLVQLEEMLQVLNKKYLPGINRWLEVNRAAGQLLRPTDYSAFTSVAGKRIVKRASIADRRFLKAINKQLPLLGEIQNQARKAEAIIQNLIDYLQINVEP